MSRMSEFTAARQTFGNTMPAKTTSMPMDSGYGLSTTAAKLPGRSGIGVSGADRGAFSMSLSPSFGSGGMNNKRY
jgi:hypothetical protein